ncbi:PilZ domain-containing protein [Methylocapsa sp. S129]|uniref:PilZ domain-containing protein n=1 Tax=Methylocapsa sp. S129 TaxID=1641869 RepID=UPI00131AD7FC|nr:PilZ domain-containing protein [Methylocapsa sp. S129]
MGRLIEVKGDDSTNIRRSNLSPYRRPEVRRAEPRQRLHLRSGEVADQLHRFICDCVIRDRSIRGARLVLPRNVSVPDQIWFYDAEFKASARAEVKWRADQEIGIYIFEQPAIRRS